jgi:hypothetical protein
MKDVVIYEGFYPNLFHIFQSYNFLAMNFQNWTMDKYKTDNSFFFAAREDTEEKGNMSFTVV